VKSSSRSVRRTQSSETTDSGASVPSSRSKNLTRESADGPTTVLSPPQEAGNNQAITSHPLHTRTTRQRTRHGGEARTMPGSAAIGLPRARIHICTINTNASTNTTLVRKHRRRHMLRAIPALAGRQVTADLSTVRHVHAGKRRSWTVSIASLGLGGHSSLSDSL
jgi:hypothetical protein